MPKAVVASAKRDVVDVVRPAAFVPMPAPTKAKTIRIATIRFITFRFAVWTCGCGVAWAARSRAWLSRSARAGGGAWRAARNSCVVDAGGCAV